MKEKHRKKTEKSKGVSQTIAKGWEGWGKLVKNGPKWQKNFCLLHCTYLGNHTSHDYHLWYTCVKW